MKKTFDFLHDKGIDYDFIDYKKQAPSHELLVKFSEKVGYQSLINKKGTTYRKLEEKEKEKLEIEEKALAILSAKSSMIKRPIVEFPDGKLILGFEPEVLEANL